MHASDNSVWILTCFFAHSRISSLTLMDSSRSVMSPKRKKSKSKRRAEGDTVPGVVAQIHKRSKNASPDSGQLEDQPHGTEPRRSSRSGAGSGGRIDQLQKVGTVLEAPIKLSKKTTDIPEGTLDNPLAPDKSRRRRNKKVSLPSRSRTC